jgi:hypothetical protein
MSSDFDIDALYAALDAERVSREMSWSEVVRAINSLFKNVTEIGGINPAGLARLANGGRVGFPDVTRIAEWLGRPVARFTRGFIR